METRKQKKVCADVGTNPPGDGELDTQPELQIFPKDDLGAGRGGPHTIEMEQLSDLLRHVRQMQQDMFHLQREVQQSRIQQTERPSAHIEELPILNSQVEPIVFRQSSATETSPGKAQRCNATLMVRTLNIICAPLRD